MNQPSYHVLERIPLPQLAAALRKQSETILKKWRDAVQDVLPHADELTRKQLDNSLPKLLQELASALEASDSKPTKKLLADSPAHGETRFHQHFRLDELLVEYDLLRRTVVQQIAADLGRDLSVDECVGLNSGIDIALRQATIEFTEHQAIQLTSQTNVMSKYLSFLSHDIRGSLNGAVLTIELLRRDLAKEPKFAQSMEEIDLVKRSIFATVSTMDRLLHAEQLRRGKVPVKVADVDLAKLIDQAIQIVLQQRPKSGEPIKVDLSAAPETAKSDSEALLIIMVNLLNNAVKYARAAAVRVVASKQSGGVVRLSVIDEGPGIAPEKKAAIFTPFTRGDTHGQDGVGLGLTIAQQTADLLGAKLSLESEVGKGSAFHLDLPAPPKS